MLFAYQRELAARRRAPYRRVIVKLPDGTREVWRCCCVPDLCGKVGCTYVDAKGVAKEYPSSIGCGRR